MNRQRIFAEVVGETAGAVFKAVCWGSTVLFLFLIAEDIDAIREQLVPTERENLLRDHNRIMDTIRRGN